jgi:surfactin synthase thioesterase subunit/glycosyltransferase involved in cell wall biosynthesis
MRILLAHNSLYYPSHGGGDKSNRLLMEALAARGHQVRVVTRVEQFGRTLHETLLQQLEDRGVESSVQAEGIAYRLNRVDVHVLTLSPQLRGFFSRQIESFHPDVILTSTDDPGQLLFDLALKAPRARVVHLVRATIAVPFGPDSSSESPAKTEMLRRADGVVGVSEYVATYVLRWSGIPAVHVPISLMEVAPEYERAGRFENAYVSIVNPCAVKGIDIFLALADIMPSVQFAAVPTWGTTAGDLEALRLRSNITVLAPVDEIDELLRLTKVMLVPSVWAEARSRIVVEAMLRGVPVISSDTGGIPEAHLGVEYVLPVNPVLRYKPSLDMKMVPVAEVPPQNIEPWQRALERLVSDRAHYEDLSARSRQAALSYVRNLNVLPFEQYLQQVVSQPKQAIATGGAAPLSEEKRKLLSLRLKKRASAAAINPWVPEMDEAEPGKLVLFCFPYAGAGTLVYRPWRERLRSVASVCPVRLPGRESRLNEPPFERMEALIPALGEGLLSVLKPPFAFFGHSMGAGIAFELARWLRRHAHVLPQSLHVSAARAPQQRVSSTTSDPTDEELLEQIRRLHAAPSEVLSRPELLRVALPALRADTKLYRGYAYLPEGPLAIPLFAYSGTADASITPAHMEAWREQTSRRFVRREFESGHFYIESRREEFLTALAEDLRPA